MKVRTHTIIFTGLLVVAFMQMACMKEELEAKPDKALVVPQTVGDYQALLDNSIMTDAQPWLGEIASDDYYVLPARLNAVTGIQRNAYLWLEDVYQDVPVTSGAIVDWVRLYTQVYYANIVIDGLSRLPEDSETEAYKHAKGSALFHRAYAYWWLAQLFCNVYDSGTANNDLGLPLRMIPDPLVKVPRSTLKETYELILQDLIEAKPLLYTEVVTPKRPSKKTIDGMLARVYLSMSDFDNAFVYASNCLSAYSTLMDYNQFNENAAAPFPLSHQNPEIIYDAFISGASIVVNGTNAPIDTTLYKSYESNDLRKTIFFTVAPSTGLRVFKGSYYGSLSYVPWTGIATDEIYLIRAESYARKGDATNAMLDLNTLLKTRWRTGTFVPLVASNPAQALDFILKERRKELVFRGVRWTDLRRLNKEGANITLTRVINGQTYTLPPNDPRYVYPIPPYELIYNPMPDNIRTGGGI